MSAPTSRIPHKEAALALSEPDDRARAVGASNTLWLDNGRLRSTNTDVEGFTANLDAAVPGWDQRAGEAVVLGAGGSARAVVYGLIERGIGKIHVVNRTPERAEALRARFGPAVQPAHWAALPHLLARAGLLVNTTSLGMTGQPPLDDRSWAAAPAGRRRRPGLCAAGNARCWPPPARAASRPPTGSECCCIRRCGAFSSGSGCGRR